MTLNLATTTESTNSLNSVSPFVSTSQLNHNENVTTSEETVYYGFQPEEIAEILLKELQITLKKTTRSSQEVVMRIALEVQRICQKSNRIQNSGEIQTWQLDLARHRLQKCLQYYRLGSRQGRVELHSHLASMVYRHVASFAAQLNFQGRYNLIEDFLQGFYIETLRAFRREHQMAADYTPRTQLELAEYMAFAEQYAKRQIGLPGRNRQRLIVLRAQGFAKGQPPETAIDIEMAVESAKGEESENHSRSAAVQQVREQMVSECIDPAEGVLRDRVVAELIEYLKSQGHSDCVDYLVLKLKDLSASEIDEILGLSPRQRDYLQQRFKYHVEKFARSQNWQLVHQWLGAELDQKLGMTSPQWEAFKATLSPEQLTLLEMKRNQESDKTIASALKCTPKQVQKRWTQLLSQAAIARNA